ncbi:hypothetical protein D6T64_03575 [Cryobacterium melibiosiphilum]|uniref:T3SS peptide-binding chaperone domain-containing protein n=1 Tax=Cryobacterium melibiosiphilum TaxID=995039 RepID=A0A3A5MS03_9MICO|nr:hypothetical protein [Cryobacterium melibiosiphilum]RJT90609.1 hypothetical protein D6T64_03575 [Cryobacterium melibiosiphilum]
MIARRWRYGPDLPLAERFLTAQMWWIGSELVRRHPHLVMTMVDVDALIEPQDLDVCERRWLLLVHDDHVLQVQFDLADGIEYRRSGGPQSLSWAQVFAATGPLDIVAQLEQALHLDSPRLTPAATPQTLVYRVISSALATGLDDPHEWCAVPAPISIDDVPGSPGGPLFEGFSSTAVPRGHYARSYLLAEHRAQRTLFPQPFWALLRDDEPIAIFDTAGVVHTVLGSTDLLPFYEVCGRELALITARILGPYLP